MAFASPAILMLSLLPFSLQRGKHVMQQVEDVAQDKEKPPDYNKPMFPKVSSDFHWKKKASGTKDKKWWVLLFWLLCWSWVKGGGFFCAYILSMCAVFSICDVSVCIMSVFVVSVSVVFRFSQFYMFKNKWEIIRLSKTVEYLEGTILGCGEQMGLSMKYTGLDQNCSRFLNA